MSSSPVPLVPEQWEVAWVCCCCESCAALLVFTYRCTCFSSKCSLLSWFCPWSMCFWWCMRIWPLFATSCIRILWPTLEEFRSSQKVGHGSHLKNNAFAKLQACLGSSRLKHSRCNLTAICAHITIFERKLSALQLHCFMHGLAKLHSSWAKLRCWARLCNSGIKSQQLTKASQLSKAS